MEKMWYEKVCLGHSSHIKFTKLQQLKSRCKGWSIVDACVSLLVCSQQMRRVQIAPVRSVYPAPQSPTTASWPPPPSQTAKGPPRPPLRILTGIHGPLPSATRTEPFSCSDATRRRCGVVFRWPTSSPTGPVWRTWRSRSFTCLRWCWLWKQSWLIVYCCWHCIHMYMF